MKIDKERTGCSISVHMDESADFLRDRMNHAAECMEDIFVPSDVVWNQNQYTFYVSHRQSLKEYIYENGLDMGSFCAFLKKIAELYTDAIRFEIDPHDFIFDYECIFVGSSVYDSEFIYAPDSETYKDGAVVYNKCSDMVAIVSLHIDYAPNNEGAAAETAVSEVIRILSEWEAGGSRTNSAFPIEQIHLILAKWDTDLNGRNSFASWKWFCIAEGAAACAMLLWFFREQQQEVSGFLVGAWLLLFLCIAY